METIKIIESDACMINREKVFGVERTLLLDGEEHKIVHKKYKTLGSAIRATIDLNRNQIKAESESYRYNIVKALNIHPQTLKPIYGIEVKKFIKRELVKKWVMDWPKCNLGYVEHYFENHLDTKKYKYYYTTVKIEYKFWKQH